MFRELDEDSGHSRVGIRAGRTPAPDVQISTEAGQVAPETSKFAPEPSETGPLPEPRAWQGGDLVPRPAGPIIEIDAQAMGKTGQSTRKPNRRRLAIVGVLLLAAIGSAGMFGHHWWTVGRFTVSTDDAYVRAHNTTLAAKIPGYVASVLVEDNAYVRSGELVATIDDGDYRLAVDAARDKVATQQATVDRIGRQIEAQQSAIEQAKAQLVSVQVAAKRTQLELNRQQALANREFASRQTLEKAQADRDQAIAGVQSAQAALEAAQAAVAVLQAQQQEAARAVKELQTAQAKAERDLSFTEIRAPVNGVFGNRAVQTGDFVQTGQRLASLVPLDDVYIEANFKETQLARLKPGQKVAISVDAIPEHAIDGTVASVSPASGAVFSLLPPDNATGNFTKIVQRVPVRIEVPANVASQRVLRPGLSVVVSINTKPTATADAAPGLNLIAPAHAK